MRARPTLLWLLVFLVAGCGTFSNHLTPRPTRPGEIDLAVALDVVGGPRGLGNQAILPNPEIRLRGGLAEGFDLGAKINFLGGELSSRIALVEGTFDLSVVPAVGVLFSTFTSEETESIVLSGKLGVLGGLHLGDVVTLVAGPAFIVHRGGDGDVLLYPGGTLGVNIQIVRLLALFPEVNVYRPFHLDLERWRKPIVQGGLALRLTFGGD